MKSELKISDEQCAKGTMVHIAGELDIYTSQQLKNKLYGIIDKVQSDLILELSELNYIDSTGLGIFVGALKKARQHGKSIYITGLKDNIRKLFIITGLDRLFIIEE